MYEPELKDIFKELCKYYIFKNQLSITTVNKIEQSLEDTISWFHNEIASPYIKMRKRSRQGRREAT